MLQIYGLPTIGTTTIDSLVELLPINEKIKSFSFCPAQLPEIYFDIFSSSRSGRTALQCGRSFVLTTDPGSVSALSPSSLAGDVVRVVVADDDLPSRDLLLYLLQHRGYDICCADNGLQAYELLRAEDVPTIAILDWVMPGMSGVELCSAIRRLRRQHYIYAMLLTVKGDRRDLLEGLRSGADDYLTKPTDPGELLARTLVAERIIGYLRDLRRAEAELETSRMQAVASARLSALGVMASGIAHEINNPLAIIHALSSDLEDTAGRGEVTQTDLSRDAARIRQTAERINKIVRSLRVIAREGVADPSEEASARQIIEETLELCRERFNAHSVRLMVPPVDPGLRVFCREAQIAQILLNLLHNAFDAVMAREGDKWVEISAVARGPQVVFSVVDNGPGIPPELVSRIMEPFFTTKPVGKGTGLGLSISKAIALQNGGDLQLCADSGHTCFCLSLPAERPG